ncbi:MAG: SMP-30/gluconolactonase/LRE family protein [Actinomycetota bacterium]|nr:SMP-30/gluconolactonase/LRE family protein [Actinomycetota bacterium]
MIEKVQVRELSIRGHFFESPRYREGSWYVSDFYSGEIIRINSDGVGDVIVKIDGQPSGIGWFSDNTMVFASMVDRSLFTFDGEKVELFADLTHLCGGHLNDIWVSKDDVVYCANFGFDLDDREDPRDTDLIAVDRRGVSKVCATGLKFPNGIVTINDGRTLVVAETLGNDLLSFDIADDGALGESSRSVVYGEEVVFRDFMSTMAQLKVAPDGIATLGDDLIYVADPRGGLVHASRIGGESKVILDLGRQESPFAVAVADNGGDLEMLVCVAPDSNPKRRRSAQEAKLLLVSGLD